MNRKFSFYKLFQQLTLIFCSFLMIFPFLWMILSSLKTKEEIMNPHILFPTIPQFHNYIEVIAHSPILRYVCNSLFVSICIVILQLVISALLAYALVFLTFKGRKFLFITIFFTYMLPSVVTYIPVYTLLASWKLLDSYQGLILSYSVNLFGIFLLHNAFLQMPFSLIEAAQLDGASHWQILWKMVYPMTTPSFVTFALISFISNYNSYLWPSLITTNPNLRLVSQGLRQFFIEDGAHGTNWPQVMAASAVTILPLFLLFLFAGNKIISGISDTGVKG